MAQYLETKYHRSWSRLVAKAWDDDEFKARLFADTEACLAEAGIPVPEGVTVQVVEGTEFDGPDDVLVLPFPKPSADTRGREYVQDRLKPHGVHAGLTQLAIQSGRLQTGFTLVETNGTGLYAVNGTGFFTVNGTGTYLANG